MSSNDEEIKKIKKENNNKDSEFERFKKNVFISKGEELSNDRMYEMIVDSVIAKVGRTKNYNQEDSNEGFAFFKSFLLQLLVGLSVFFLLTLAMLKFNGGMNFPGVPAGPKTFEYEPAESFRSVKILGMKDILRNTIATMFKKCMWMEILDTERVIDITEPASLNYLLHGVPGTGKTTFTRRIAYSLDICLREAYLYKINGGKDSETIKQMKKDGLLMTAILNVKSRVKFLYITPSMISDKYVGESEKNIKRLFEDLEKENESLTATVVLFDEADSVFKNRENEGPNGSNSRGLQSELLSRLGQIPKNIRPVFIFAATNIINDFDPAFIRRFSNKIEFCLPNWEERREIITHFLRSVQSLTSDDIKKIVECSVGKSQAYITRNLKEYFKYNLDGELKGYDIDGLIKQLTRVEENQNINY